ncbi:LOW QUALITY PROTEIN: hypothetical protein HZS_6526 [Henneguya salminicola]|nr:LOW QUALITY PROTEIN: hypothetical protein HZS_6526 [Henneguya salminicola]
MEFKFLQQTALMNVIEPLGHIFLYVQIRKKHITLLVQLVFRSKKERKETWNFQIAFVLMTYIKINPARFMSYCV